MHIVGISGSLRRNSYNTMLLHEIKRRYKSMFQLEIVSIHQLPLFNQDEELNPPKVVKELKAKIQSCDRVIIATPEYNWSVPGALKNSLDWLSRGERPMIGKPTMIIGASTGPMGTIRAQIDLRKILSSPGLAAHVLPPTECEFLVTYASKKFSANGHLIDENTIQRLDHIIQSFLQWH